MRKKAYNTPIRGSKSGKRYSLRKTREDFSNMKDHSISRLNMRNSAMDHNNNSSIFSFERRNLDKELMKSQKLNSSKNGSKFLQGFA